MSATIVRYNDSRLQYTPPLGWAGATVPYTRPEYNMPVKDNAGVLLGFIGVGIDVVGYVSRASNQTAVCVVDQRDSIEMPVASHPQPAPSNVVADTVLCSATGLPLEQHTITLSLSVSLEHFLLNYFRIYANDAQITSTSLTVTTVLTTTTITTSMATTSMTKDSVTITRTPLLVNTSSISARTSSLLSTSTISMQEDPSSAAHPPLPSTHLGEVTSESPIFKPGPVIACVVGGVVALATLAILGRLYMRRKRKTDSIDYHSNQSTTNKGARILETNDTGAELLAAIPEMLGEGSAVGASSESNIANVKPALISEFGTTRGISEGQENPNHSTGACQRAPQSEMLSTSVGEAALRHVVTNRNSPAAQRESSRPDRTGGSWAQQAQDSGWRRGSRSDIDSELLPPPYTED